MPLTTNDIITKNKSEYQYKRLFCKVTDKDYTLFKALLERMPHEIICSNAKKDFAIRKKEKNNIALLNYKWIVYNQDLNEENEDGKGHLWHLNFDIDAKYTFYEVKEFLKEKFNLTPTWLCYTERGIQFGFMLVNVLKTKKQYELARTAKKVITVELEKKFKNVDKTASHKLRWYWRNPILHKHEYTGTFIELKTLKLNVLIPYTPKPFISKKTIKKEKNDKYPIPKVTYKNGEEKEIIINYPDGFYKVVKLTESIYIYDNNLTKGNRNTAIWYNLMVNTNSTDFEEVYALAEYFNSLCDEPLEKKELRTIAKSVLGYNKSKSNELFDFFGKKRNRILSVRTYHKDWEIGKMGYEKIKGLNYDEYLEEVRKRQSEAGKMIGKENLKKANQKKANEAKEKVFKILQELKQKGEKITIKKVEALAGVSYVTSRKYIKQAREEGII
jgi:hypothetical protein